MQKLMCPDCQEVMQQVERVTVRTSKVGINTLARHCSELHVVPAMERMLVYTANLGISCEELLEMTEILCPGCGATLHEDSDLYVRKNGRTILCCSKQCRAKAAHG